ncbi:MAG: metal-sulfur cluster assembly factor, partial [Verrucomicrobiia bacterium]
MNTNPTSPELNDIWARLRTVIDPELGINIVDLGLVYSAELQEGTLEVVVTLTTRGCPLHEVIVEGIQRALEGLPNVCESQVNVVWDPPWNPSMMNETARE